MGTVYSGCPDMNFKTQSRSKSVAARQDHVTLTVVAKELIAKGPEMWICYSKEEEKQHMIH
jgi:hypothetical protein